MGCKATSHAKSEFLHRFKKDPALDLLFGIQEGIFQLDALTIQVELIEESFLKHPVTYY